MSVRSAVAVAETHPVSFIRLAPRMSAIPLRYRLRSKVGILFREKLMRGRRKFLATARTSCRQSQQATLQGLLELNAGTQFSKDFGLRPGMSISEFRSCIPVSDYSLVAPYIDQMKLGNHRALLGARNKLLMYAVTSGTTSESKLIPVTDRFVSDYRRSWQTWGAGCHHDHTDLQKLFMVQVASSHRRFDTADGTPCGNISGLVAAMQKFMVRALYTIPQEVAHLRDPLAKRDAVVRFAITDPWVGMLITANPSTILQMAEYASEHTESLIRDIHDGTASQVKDSVDRAAMAKLLRPRKRRARQLEQLAEQHGELRLSDCWSKMTCLGVWSGGSAGAYLPQLRKIFENVPVRDHGLHASEGRMTLPIEDNTPSGILEIESHFFEFIPIDQADSTDPAVLEAHELEEGQEYLILLTTSSGLYRYNIRDVVRCTGYYGSTPLLEFRHKGAHISSITGEKIAESQVVEAVQAAAAELNMPLLQYTLTSHWGEPPGYTLYVHGGQELNHESMNQLASRADSLLARSNCEYREKRDTERLGKVQVQQLPVDAWRQFANHRLAATGGSPEQYKHPCLVPDPQFENIFLQQCGQPTP